jgi:HPt (histidine-containing phosphotransfer) domain-containing protein
MMTSIVATNRPNRRAEGIAALIGKYSGLAVAIALFLVLDLGVLAFSFYVSSEIQGDAARINRASELRMLTQQITKSLLTLRDETAQQLPNQTSMAQLSQARPVFNENLARLASDVELQKNDPVQKALLGERLETNGALIEKLAKTWGPMDRALAGVVATQNPTQDDVEFAATKAVALNIKLAQQSDELAAEFEQTAGARAAMLKRVQIVGIALATINFIFIVFKFLRSLAASDRTAMVARREMQNILSTVQEGLFLIHADGTLAKEHSATLVQMLGVPFKPGDHYRDLFAHFLDADDATAAIEYLDLLLGGNVAPGLVAQLNPLREVTLKDSGSSRERTLAFAFSVVNDAEKNDALLVTVLDISDNIRLANEVDAVRERAAADAELLSEILGADSLTVQDFLARSRYSILEINAALKTVSTNQKQQALEVDAIFREVHSLKGQAAAIGLRGFSGKCHSVEDLLSKLRTQRKIRGEDWIAVALALSNLLAELDHVGQIVDKLKTYTTVAVLPEKSAAPHQRVTAALSALASTVARDLGKQVELQTEGLELLTRPHLALLGNEVLPQLVRNAVAHGIERADDRRRLGKNVVGRLHVGVNLQDGAVAISVRDDGQGLGAGRLRESLVKTGRFTLQTLDSMDERSLVATLFQPGISTAHEANEHAGRGVGLDVVKEAVTRVGGRIRVVSQPDGFTEFRLTLPAHIADTKTLAA